jgi:hypothetical protein
MAERDKRQKASDVWAEHTPWIGEKVPFAEAYPTIEWVVIEVEESYIQGHKESYKLDSSEHTIGKFFDCHNSKCYKGGVDLGEVLDHMVQNHLTEFEAEAKPCRGYEGSPKGKKQTGPCFRRFKVKATISYIVK